MKFGIIIAVVFLNISCMSTGAFAQLSDKKRLQDPTATQKLIDPIPFNFDVFNIPRYHLTSAEAIAITNIGVDAATAKITLDILRQKIKEKNLFIKRLCLFHLKSLDLIKKEKDIKGIRVNLLLMSIMEIEAKRTGIFFSTFEKSLENSDMKTANRMIAVYETYLTSYLETYNLKP